MKRKYSVIYNRVIHLMNKYKYHQFIGPLTHENYQELIETMSHNNCLNESYSLLTKKDMEIRVNYLDSIHKKEKEYCINSSNSNYLFSLFYWSDPYRVVANLYAGLTSNEKKYFTNILLHNDIYFDSLSKELILLGFDKNKIYTMNNEIEE